ncbi:Chromosome partition protein smc [Lachnospiraceae bacterium TWA4]|nr:Chromosome partition protein smc [Lachnospiraceae bacterium TWA4]
MAISKSKSEQLAKEEADFLSGLDKEILEREKISQDLTSIEKEIYRLEQQLKQAEEKREEQINYLWTTYELTPSEAKNYYRENLKNLPKEILRLKEEMKALGTVNIHALEEYKELSSRLEFMRKQYTDLLQAKEQLQGLIKELDTGMRKQFTLKFKEINETFNEVFKELFGGGQASLSLIDTDILDAGIEMMVQPPGKKLQNMMQLSGGERALTAISLLFAIQRLKPSPFCLLDEIEAALDDANISRFAQYLEELKDHIQFIVITHRKGTMVVADRLYGITMQEKGISSLVGVDLKGE